MPRRLTQHIAALPGITISVVPALPPKLPEGAFQTNVEELLEIGGWIWHHTGDSRRSTAGLLDLVACKPPVLLFAELKTRTGRLRKGHKPGDIVRGRNGRNRLVTRPEPGQVEWIAALRQCPGVMTRVWRPADWSEIVYTLCGPEVYRATYRRDYEEKAA